MMLPGSIEIVEVGPRDGFQNILPEIPTSVKLKVLDGLIAANFRHVQLTSLVNPRAVPQMKDAQDLISYVLNHYSNDVIFNVLVPNFHGANDAIALGIKKVSYVVSASEAHNQANVKRTVNQSLDELKRINREFPQLTIKLDIATAFGCPYAGSVALEQVIRIIEEAIEIGIQEICLADTIGVANPLQVTKMMEYVKRRYINQQFSLHFHDTRGMGLANTLAAVATGVSIFEASLGGLGGCPFAPGASGNIATEDMVNMFENMGVKTGINLVKLLDTVEIVRKEIKPNLSGHMIYVRQSCEPQGIC